MSKSFKRLTYAALALGLALSMSASANEAFPVIAVTVCPGGYAEKVVACEKYELPTSRDTSSQASVAFRTRVIAANSPAEQYGLSVQAAMPDPKSDVISVAYSGQKSEIRPGSGADTQVTREGVVRLGVGQSVDVEILSLKVTIARSK
jgi:hypothetical protein